MANYGVENMYQANSIKITIIYSFNLTYQFYLVGIRCLNMINYKYDILSYSLISFLIFIALLLDLNPFLLSCVIFTKFSVNCVLLFK